MTKSKNIETLYVGHQHHEATREVENQLVKLFKEKSLENEELVVRMTDKLRSRLLHTLGFTERGLITFAFVFTYGYEYRSLQAAIFDL